MKPRVAFTLLELAEICSRDIISLFPDSKIIQDHMGSDGVPSNGGFIFLLAIMNLNQGSGRVGGSALTRRVACWARPVGLYLSLFGAVPTETCHFLETEAPGRMRLLGAGRARASGCEAYQRVFAIRCPVILTNNLNR